MATLRERMSAAGVPLEGVLLQRRDRAAASRRWSAWWRIPTFGPLLVCGLGGVQVELLRDVAFRLPPVTDLDAGGDDRPPAPAAAARRLSRRARRGPRRAGRAAAERVSALVEAVPELRELDLNPVKVLPPGQGTIVVDARLCIGRPHP